MRLNKVQADVLKYASRQDPEWVKSQTTNPDEPMIPIEPVRVLARLGLVEFQPDHCLSFRITDTGRAWVTPNNRTVRLFQNGRGDVMGPLRSIGAGPKMDDYDRTVTLHCKDCVAEGAWLRITVGWEGTEEHAVLSDTIVPSWTWKTNGE